MLSEPLALKRPASAYTPSTKNLIALITAPIVKMMREAVSRETHYALVWSEPMLKVAAKFGVSSSYLARVCTLLNVPRPERGYWAKLAVGKAPSPPSLPMPQPGDVLAWSRDGNAVRLPRPLPQPPAVIRRNKKKPSVQVLAEHFLTRGVTRLFEEGRLSFDGEYLKPAKRLLVDLAVSKTGLEKALSFANQLFLALEAHGHRVVIASVDERLRRENVNHRESPSRNPGDNDLWSPQRPTVVYVGTVAIGLTIIEMSEEVQVRYVNGKYIRDAEYNAPKRRRYVVDNTRTTTRELASGRLCLQAYSPYGVAKWLHHWHETSNRDLQSQVPAIVKRLAGAAIEIAQLVEEGARQAEIERQRWQAEHQKWLHEEALRHAAKARKESREELLLILDVWGESQKLEQFFAEVERQSAPMPEQERLETLGRLKLARDLIGNIDALEQLRRWKSPSER